MTSETMSRDWTVWILQSQDHDSERAQRHLHCAVVMRRWDSANGPR